ncbi:hypothetical protein D3C73_1433230 [compost metagenome]
MFAGADKQRRTDFFFKLVQAFAERGLRDIQHLRRLADGTLLGDGTEVAHSFEIHLSLPVSLAASCPVYKKPLRTEVAFCGHPSVDEQAPVMRDGHDQN